MTNHEILLENYEDSVLALLMDELAESEGRRYSKENGRLQSDPGAAVPEEVERRALRFIDRAFKRKDRDRSGGRILRILGRVAIAALIAILLFSMAFALSDTVRAGTLNFLMQIDAKIATWQFVRDEGAGTGANFNNSFVLITEWLPDGYLYGKPEFITPVDCVLDCTSNEGGRIHIQVHESENNTFTLDLEDADYYEDITVQGQQGILVLKNDLYRIVWTDHDLELLIYVDSSTVDADTLLQVAENIAIISR